MRDRVVREVSSPPLKTAKPIRPSALAKVAAKGIFELHDISAQLDSTGFYKLPFHREFPLSLRAFRYRANRFTQGATWHEQLELFCPIDGVVDVRMGNQTVKLGPGDLLVVDNQKLHHVVDHPDLDTRVIVVSFLPELVYSLGSSSHDFAFLLPFYAQLEDRPHVLRSSEPAAQEAAEALGKLVEEFFRPEGTLYREAACKACLLALLSVLLRRFQDAEVLQSQFERRRQLAQRFSRLLEHMRDPVAPRLSLGEAARMCGMSPAKFTRCFKQVAGMSYLAYLTHLRLAEAARLLRLGERSIAEIADLLGFADQSHFDRRFKRAFGLTPSLFQRQGRIGT